MKNSKPIAITLMSILSLFGCGPSKAPEYPSDQLTAREREIATHFAQGRSRKEIAKHLALYKGKSGDTAAR